MEHQEEQQLAGTKQSTQEALQEGMPTRRFTSKPIARKKVKATRKGRKSLRPPKGGEGSRSLEDSPHTSEDVEGESGEVVAGAGDNVGDVPLIDTQSQNVEALPGGVDLNVSSHVEEVAAAIHKVLGQGKSNVEPFAGVVEEEPTTASPSKEAEVVIQTEVICLGSDDDVPERRVELDVRVKVKNRLPYRVCRTFADYMMDESEDEDYG